MKHKKLFAFMIIVSTLLVCCTMSISASDIWNGNGDEEFYIIEGWLFEQLDENYSVEFNSIDGYSAYVYAYGQKMWIQSKDDVGVYLVATEHREEVVTIDEYDVYISRELYAYWEAEEGQIPTLGIVTAGGGAKEVFDVATDVTREVAFGFFDAFWNNGLTFWGWLIAISFGLITTSNIIKMISNSL